MPLDAPLPPLTVLIVDDDAIVRRVVQGHLSDAGYRIFEAEDGQEALEVLDRTGSVNLVIVDMVMPRLNGPGLVEEFLPKPFTREQLLSKVAEASQVRATEPT